MQTPIPTPSPLAARWQLDPGIVYLNHGSFGACPRDVLAAQRRYRDRMEADGVAFFVEAMDDLMDASRDALAGFLRCPPESLACVPNATTAVATVFDNLVQSGVLGRGDEILVPSHEYPACKNNAARAAQRAGATVVPVELPFPCTGPLDVIDPILAAVTPRTKVALLSHVTSSTGMVLPVDDLVRELERRGVRTIVDGAHAAGMLPLDLNALAPSYYTSNCHKWLCTPKGSAFLYVRPDLVHEHGGFRPLALSNRAFAPKPGRPHLWTEFDYCGTADPTAWMAIRDGLAFMPSLVTGGWVEVMVRNRLMCATARARVCEALGVRPPVPETMLGSIATIILPPARSPEHAARLAARPTKYHDALQDALLTRHRIQVPIWGLPGKPERFIRVSAQVYNSAEQYEYLIGALVTELDLEARA